VKRYGPQIITQNGVPAAYLVPTSALGIEVDIDTIRSLHFAQTLATAQTEAARAGTSGMSMEAIDAEISAMRTERRRTRR
jgi:PHD/YefM family antitoxin component YafN of YafNO toxin-antitoxin module